ncbi:plastocyanin/azurin family copper-binding protein [Halogeometricum sp. S1BR25-6]|uniref:Plastocyanin/azurin family copper-binding protein n=1 Tax=Halogeometricum salsisoli TaxID=2950536 RepID=A0ABU2GKS3_9EURY|nr:plastocyanin/azurin family copper-binding protein [Halogeometricum sp. S1BR25-6]MDS0301417.1 plastocyanin/azurin family copper-binding protein [Halogeometricum sp. S1BR25-6]
MERRQYLKATSITATGGLMTLAGCSSSGTQSDNGDSTSESQHTTDSSGEATGDSNTVLMVTEGSQYYFDPIGLFVETGDTVTFKIRSGNHSATAYQKGNGPASVTRIPDGAQAFDSGTLSERGATFQYTFETTGTFDYYCLPHKTLGMVGRIVVGKPGGPAEGSMPPDGKVPKSETIVDNGRISSSDFSR